MFAFKKLLKAVWLSSKELLFYARMHWSGMFAASMSRRSKSCFCSWHKLFFLAAGLDVQLEVSWILLSCDATIGWDWRSRRALWSCPKGMLPFRRPSKPFCGRVATGLPNLHSTEMAHPVFAFLKTPPLKTSQGFCLHSVAFKTMAPFQACSNSGCQCADKQIW